VQVVIAVLEPTKEQVGNDPTGSLITNKVNYLLHCTVEWTTTWTTVYWRRHKQDRDTQYLIVKSTMGAT
jgi:hypothetical protein